MAVGTGGGCYRLVGVSRTPARVGFTRCPLRDLEAVGHYPLGRDDLPLVRHAFDGRWHDDAVAAEPEHQRYDQTDDAHDENDKPRGAPRSSHGASASQRRSDPHYRPARLVTFQVTVSDAPQPLELPTPDITRF